MTLSQLIQRAKRRLNAGTAQPHVWPDNELDLAANVDAALHEMAHNVMMDDNRRSWLQQDYAVTLSAAGESTNLLSVAGSVTGEVGEVILEGIYYGVVKDADNNVLIPLRQYSDFLRPQPTVYGYYTLKNQVIATRAVGVGVTTPADITTVNGPLTVTASYTPKLVSDVPLALEDDLVGHLCEVVLRKTASPAAA